MVALRTLQIATYLSGLTFLVAPDPVAATGTSTLVHVCDLVLLRRSLPLGMRTTFSGGFGGM